MKNLQNFGYVTLLRNEEEKKKKKRRWMSVKVIYFFISTRLFLIKDDTEIEMIFRLG